MRKLAEALVPGDYPQVQEDVISFGGPVLNLLHEYGMQVAVLDEGQSLADSPALRFPTESEYAQERSNANTVVKRAFKAAVQTGGGVDPKEFAESTTRELRKNNLEFHLALSNRQVSLEEIAERQKIEAENLPHWTNAFIELNKDLPQGLYILPHQYMNGRAIPENRLRNAGQLTSEFVERNLGINRPEERLVVVHQKFTAENAEEVGNYRLVLHELGHALDRVLETTTNLPGFGMLHRETVDRLYQLDLEKAKTASKESVFTSDRASDDVREYFAEAVEAYLTFPGPVEGEIFRAGNSNPGLQSKNPELYSYMENLFSTPIPSGVAPKAPAISLLPEGIPNPDTEVVYF